MMIPTNTEIIQRSLKEVYRIAKKHQKQLFLKRLIYYFILGFLILLLLFTIAWLSIYQQYQFVHNLIIIVIISGIFCVSFTSLITIPIENKTMLALKKTAETLEFTLSNKTS